MVQWLPTIVNGALVLILGGVIWKMLNDKIEGKAKVNADNIEKKVDKAWCAPTHQAITDDLKEIKSNQRSLKGDMQEQHDSLVGQAADVKEIKRYLEQINGNLAGKKLKLRE